MPNECLNFKAKFDESISLGKIKVFVLLKERFVAFLVSCHPKNKKNELLLLQVNSFHLCDGITLMTEEVRTPQGI